ncbi:MAG: hypothetical protein M1838_004581 [Thelocarpon superellum]|nr:MAG: hypothetical protein M1838_004581 [Thelocarpon superellum]
MGTWTGFVVVYVLGGLTFVPLLLTLVGLHAYLTLPVRPAAPPRPGHESLHRAGDDDDVLRSSAGAAAVRDTLHARDADPDEAAGYFAVCREYVPGGVNGKPPERTTPAGAVVAAESASVYQSMYRSIFDRSKPGPTMDPGKGPRRARNVFFVVLRHGHLMLYDDAEQLEVRHVISLGHHDVSLSAGPGDIPEGELWIRRNAICLTRKATRDALVEPVTSKPFYLFSENCSDKEDFYFALLRHQDDAPVPRQFDVAHVIALVQRLHGSDEQLHTRWINGLVGRLFLAFYRSPDVERFVRNKIAKKIARVKKPAFLTDIVLQAIDLGDAAPAITNPRLKELTVDGTCVVEADVRYTGHVRLEVAATARIDLGSRFKPREVDLVLAVVLHKVEGHALLRCKAPPSNRLWLAFDTMPKMEMSIEPLVSSRAITYNIILRAIESRIREVIAETLVVPHWDDLPLSDTAAQRVRGGLWVDDADAGPAGAGAPVGARVERVERMGRVEQTEDAGVDMDPDALGALGKGAVERTVSMPNLEADPSPAPPSPAPPGGVGPESRPRPGPDKPKAVRAGSFTAARPPVVRAETVTVDAVRKDAGGDRPDAARAMMAISTRSTPVSPMDSPVGSPATAHGVSPDRPEQGPTHDARRETPRREASPSPAARSPGVLPSTPARAPAPTPPRLSRTASAAAPSVSSAASEKRASFPALLTATAAAKKWGLSVLNRTPEHPGPREGTPEHPMGRGRPLPPPGMPLPRPGKDRTLRAPAPAPRRKALPAPLAASGPPDQTEHVPTRPDQTENVPTRPDQKENVPTRPDQTENVPTRPIPAPARTPSPPWDPRRREEGLMVVAAPVSDSDPSTPVDEGPDTMDPFGHALELDEADDADEEEHRAKDGAPAASDTTDPPSSNAASWSTHETLDREDEMRARRPWKEGEGEDPLAPARA